MRVDKRLLTHSFTYYEFDRLDAFGETHYKDAIIVEHCRIDQSEVYSTVQGERRQTANGVIFCFAKHTQPFFQFKTRSKVVYDGEEKTVTNIIPIYEPKKPKLWAYELEVV